MEMITSKKLAELVGKNSATVRKYAPEIPGAKKHGTMWFFTDLPGALDWFKKRAKVGRPGKAE